MAGITKAERLRRAEMTLRNAQRQFGSLGQIAVKLSKHEERLDCHFKVRVCETLQEVAHTLFSINHESLYRHADPAFNSFDDYCRQWSITEAWANELFSGELANRLHRKRDEAREKIERREEAMEQYFQPAKGIDFTSNFAPNV